MKKHPTTLFALTALLLSLLLIAPVLAGDPDDEDSTLTVITDDGEHFVFHFEDEELLRMVDGETGESVFEIDLGQIELALEEVFDGLEQTLDDLDLAVHIDSDDNYVRFAADDDEVILDFDALLDGVSEACSALGEMKFVESRHRFRGAEGMEELEAELDALREEMRELKQELRKERNRSRH